MTFINNKRSKQFFYPLNSNYGRKFSQSASHQVLLKVSHRQIRNFSRPSTSLPKQFKDFFSFMKFNDFSRLALNSRPVQEPSMTWKHYKPPNYTFLSFSLTYSDITSLSSGGGTGFLTHKPFTQLPASLRDFSSFESSNVTLKLPHTKLSVFNIYRPPSSVNRRV